MSLLSTLASYSSIKQKLIVAGVLVGVSGIFASGLWLEEHRLTKAGEQINKLNTTIGEKNQAISDRDATIVNQDGKIRGTNDAQADDHNQEVKDDKAQSKLAAENSSLKKQVSDSLKKAGANQPLPADTKRVLQQAINKLNSGDSSENGDASG